MKVEPIREKLKLMRRGSSIHVENGGPRQSTNKDPSQSVNESSYYYWVDYLVEVEFKDGSMSYQLLIDGVEDHSFKGTVALGPSIEAWNE